MTKIGTIKIKGVRGIRSELTLDLEGKPLLMRGDNGSGKSSIAQALRWALMGRLTSMTSATIPAEYQRHLLEEDDAAAEVAIDLLPRGRIVMKGGAIDASLTDAEGKAYIDACKRSSPFLRRDELLGFLTDSPGERFKYLERFLELDAVDSLLSNLVPLAKSHEGSASADRDRVARSIEKVYGELSLGGGTPATVSDLVSALHADAKRLALAIPGGAPSFETLEQIRTTLPKTKLDAASVQRRAQLSAALDRARGLVPPDHPQTVLGPLREAEQRAEETDLAPLLAAAAAAVERHPDRESCPVCEQAVTTANLAERLRSRLALLADVRTLTERADRLGMDWSTFFQSLDELEAVANASPREQTTAERKRRLLEELDASDSDTLSARILARLEALRTKLETARDAIPDELRASELAKLAKAIDAALAARGVLEQATLSEAEHTSRAKALRAIEKAVSNARKDVVDSTMKDIEAQVRTFYERVHPPDADDEVTGAPKIKIRRHGSGTAHVQGQFNKSEVGDPLFVYSDGHLDTVGICVFLALRKRSSAGPKLLVLDDIVLSIDLGHADRLVKLLREEFKDHQILLFSHNELFMKMCRAPFSQAKHMEIIQWTLEHGPRIAGHVSNIDELKDKLANSGSAEKVATAMRPVLDGFLLDACSAFEVKVPLTRGRGLTVEEYWSPLRSKLIDLTKAGLLPNFEATFENIGTPSFFRNALGAHLNPWALEVALKQVQRVARAILSLVEALTCTACKQIPHLLNPREPKQGFGCDCPRGTSPALPHHSSKSESDR